MRLKILLTLLLFSNLLVSNAQENNVKSPLSEGSINEQFDYVIEKSNRYQEYKVIKTNWLYTLKSNTLDSVQAFQNQLKETNKIISEQSREIETLKRNLEKTNSSLDQVNLEKNSMSLFGMQLSKNSYNAIMWLIIGCLFILMLVFIYKFKNSNIITKQAKLALQETEEEFEEHRKRALEREQKVMRRLQDEINKQKTSKK